jgi:hypothetical protein
MGQFQRILRVEKALLQPGIFPRLNSDYAEGIHTSLCRTYLAAHTLSTDYARSTLSCFFYNFSAVMLKGVPGRPVWKGNLIPLLWKRLPSNGRALPRQNLITQEKFVGENLCGVGSDEIYEPRPGPWGYSHIIRPLMFGGLRMAQDVVSGQGVR